MSEKTLTRADLAEAVVKRIGLPRNESADLVELVLAEISNSLEEGQQVKLSSFGSFGVREKNSASVVTRKQVKKCQSRRGVFWFSDQVQL